MHPRLLEHRATRAPHAAAYASSQHWHASSVAHAAPSPTGPHSTAPTPASPGRRPSTTGAASPPSPTTTPGPSLASSTRDTSPPHPSHTIARKSASARFTSTPNGVSFHATPPPGSPTTGTTRLRVTSTRRALGGISGRVSASLFA